MKLNRIFLSLVASLFTLFSSGQVAAQAPASVTLVKAGRLLDPRTGNVLSPAAVLIENGKIKEVGAPTKVQAPPGSGRQVASGGSSPADIVYAQPGQLVDAGGFRLNLYCMGAGSPAVVFESAFADWAPDWAVVLPRIAAWTRACVYDHAGAGFSDPGPMPRTNVRIANELHQALHNAGIGGPYILVGNASGGDPAHTFAQLYMAETAGLVLVEVDPSDLEPKALQDEDHAGNARGIAALRKCRDAVAAGGPLPSSPSHPDRTCAQLFFFRGLPEPKFSPELNAALLKIAQSKVALYDAALSEWEQMPGTEAWLQQHNQSLGSRPIRVLTTGNHAVHFLPAPNAHDPKHLEYEHQIGLAQARLLTLSSNTKQIFVPNSSEYVQFDDPDAVVDAIREVYDQTRRLAAAHRDQK